MSSRLAPTPARIFYRPNWSGADGIRRLLIIAVPLILSNAVHAINIFFDRTFLAWYSKDCFTAALQGGMLHWTLLNLPFQTVIYSSTFVAQFIGAKQDRQVGPMVWQAIYTALIGGAIMALVAPLGYPLFRWIGHVRDVPRFEAEYFLVLSLGSVVFLLNNALYGFFAGQGRTNLVLFVNACSCLLNICLNTWFIFTPTWIIPMGMMGAAWATVISAFAGFLMFALLILADRSNEARFLIVSGFRFSKGLFRRLLRFGFPAGVHGLIDMMGFTAFMMVVGVFGYEAQIASNMAMNINLLLFIPAVGLSAAVQILAGNFCGARDHASVERLTSNALILCSIYMTVVIVLYVFYPHYLLHAFRGGMPEAEWARFFNLARILLIVVAVYSVFDALVLTYSGALRGAGDTKFVMWASVVFSQVLLTGPCVALAIFRDALGPTLGLYLAWAFCSIYIVFLGLVNMLRFRFGRWKTIVMVERKEAPEARVPLMADGTAAG